MPDLTIDKSKVASVYSGKVGCCCGCNGIHRYATAHREWAGKNRGYAITDDEVNDKHVTKIVNKLIKLAKGGIYPDICEDYISIEYEGKLYIAYLLPTAPAIAQPA